jgi:hypothetical protein
MGITIPTFVVACVVLGVLWDLPVRYILLAICENRSTVAAPRQKAETGSLDRGTFLNEDRGALP